jgi:hypothetical protein
VQFDLAVLLVYFDTYEKFRVKIKVDSYMAAILIDISCSNYYFKAKNH